jgi:hypothetical protein
MTEGTPFQRSGHEPPRLAWYEKTASILSATGLALALVVLVFLVYAAWVGLFRHPHRDEPVQVWMPEGPQR